jgi:hypothetical protein
MTDIDDRAVGIAWYREDDYLLLRTMFQDGDVLPARFADWLAKARTLEQRILNNGQAVEHVYIDPVSFPLWCESHGLAMNAMARTRFADDAVAQRHSVPPS